MVYPNNSHKNTSQKVMLHCCKKNMGNIKACVQILVAGCRRMSPDCRRTVAGCVNDFSL